MTNQPMLDTSTAPLPTEKTLKGRQNVVLQFGKFIGFCLDMTIMVMRGHKKS